MTRDQLVQHRMLGRTSLVATAQRLSSNARRSFVEAACEDRPSPQAVTSTAASLSALSPASTAIARAPMAVRHADRDVRAVGSAGPPAGLPPRAGPAPAAPAVRPSTVSEGVLDEKPDELLGSVTYRHVNIAVAPNTPSHS